MKPRRVATADVDLPRKQSTRSMALSRELQALAIPHKLALYWSLYRPKTLETMKYSGSLVAALLAIKYAKSLKTACAIGLLAGVVAHSMYADVIKKQGASMPGGEDAQGPSKAPVSAAQPH